jgi:uncharacterized protein YbjT (DUF2867 family)
MILLTGPTGTVGTALVDELADRARARALVRTRAAAETLRRRGIEPVLGSFEDAASLDAALDGVDTLFLLSPPGAADMAAVQRAVVDRAASAGVHRVVKLSSIAADEQTHASIVQAHGDVERHIEASGLAWTHVRPHWFMQNELGQADAIAATGTLHAPDVGRISLVDARDVAAVVAEVLTTEGHEERAYLVTGPEALSYADIAATVAAATGARIEWKPVTLEQARASMLEGGLPPVLADGFTEILARYRDGGVTATVSPDVARLLGRTPRRFADFAAEHAHRFAAARAA